MKLPTELLPLYDDLYRCMRCSKAKSMGGVWPFVHEGPDQTIPVSHFGQILTAKIWLVATNPKGDRADSNVGFKPDGFESRSTLTQLQVEQTFENFSCYFNRGGVYSFFEPWIKTLDGIDVEGKPQTWQGGGICAVDLIKCPTGEDWGAFARNKANVKDKDLICMNCFEEVGTGRFLMRQINSHKPRVLLYAGTAPSVSENRLPNKMKELWDAWREDLPDYPAGIWSFSPPSRLSIGLPEVRKIREGGPELWKRLKTTVQFTIHRWEATQSSKQCQP